MSATVDAVEALIRQQKSLVLAGDESLLRALPEGPRIGGTIPYCRSAEGGKTSRGEIFVVEVPEFARSARVEVYDEQPIANIGIDSAENGYTILILPAFTQLHRLYAFESPRYDQQFFKVVAGWVAGPPLDDLGKAVPKEEPPRLHRPVGDRSAPAPGVGPVRNQAECRHPSGRHPWAEVEVLRSRLRGGGYRAAKPVGDHAERFLSAVLPDHGNTVFACNRVLNYLHGQLEGRRTGDFLGPMTFGEIAYQLLNQTLVHISVSKRR